MVRLKLALLFASFAVWLVIAVAMGVELRALRDAETGYAAPGHKCPVCLLYMRDLEP